MTYVVDIGPIEAADYNDPHSHNALHAGLKKREAKADQKCAGYTIINKNTRRFGLTLREALGLMNDRGKLSLSRCFYCN